MKHRNSTALATWVLALSAVLTISGCTPINRPSTASSTYVLQAAPMAHAQITRLETQATAGGLVLSGLLRNQLERNHRPSGYIDVQIITSDDTPQQNFEFPLTRLSLVHVNNGYRFRLILSSVPPAGSMLRIRYHDTRVHSSSEGQPNAQR